MLKFCARVSYRRSDARHLDLFAHVRFARRGHDRIDQFLQDDADRANSVIVSGDGIVDQFRIGVGIDNRDNRNMEPARFIDSVLFALWYR